MTIIPSYAALLALLFIYLSLRVIRTRRRERVALGDEGRASLRRAIAVHGNFAEYTPLALLLGAFVELQGLAPLLIHAIGLTLLLGRLIHAYGVSQPREDFRLRVAGMALTFTSLGLSSLVLIGSALFGGSPA
ncbi:MAG: MAPEG family protein [Candidatus Competibacteraceae bacterium]|nr:MAPEG family protein [Candidatus Competibacteraceae bacterium]